MRDRPLPDCDFRKTGRSLRGALTDEEFERLDTDFQHRLQAGRRISGAMLARVAACLGRPLIAEDIDDMPFDTKTKDARERKTCAR
jgi:hypothetical protein